MYSYLIGINYKTAPIGAREAVYRKRKELDEFLSGKSFKSAEVLYTCNRIEVYGLAKDLFEARVLIGIFCRDFAEFADYGYIRLGEIDVFRHLLRLASGLESQIKGEAQILGQLEEWLSKGHFSTSFYELAHEAILSAKNIRIKSGLGRINNNIASVVSCDLLNRIKDQARPKVIIVGTGKIAELFALNYHWRFDLYFAAHKNYIKAQELARRSGGEALELKELQGRLPEVCALISATSSPHFLFDGDYFLRATSGREDPLYLYDLAIPRDINPDVEDVSGIILNNLDTLTGVTDEYNQSQAINLLLAQELIEETVRENGKEFYEDSIKDGDTAQPLSYKTN